jgi:hypothetical protein
MRPQLAGRKKCRARVVATVTPGINPALPAQWFTAYNVLSPVIGLV